MTPPRFQLVFLFAAALLVAPVAAQDPALHDATAFRVADDAPEGLWVELTPLRRPMGRPAILLPEDSQPGLTWVPDRGAGPAMLCVGVDSGARPEADEPWLWATHCELIALWRDDPDSLLPPPDDPLVEVSAITGPPVVGRYVLGDLPVAGAVLSVAPARLDAPFPFSLPLAWTGAAPGRNVRTGEDGGFRLPRLAPGDYVLEARLPGGRLHRSDEFTVPEVEDLQTNSGTLDFEQLVFDLGDFDVQVGVSLEVRAIAPDAGPVAGVDVLLRQGRTPAELVTFRVRTGNDGMAVFDGLAVEAHSVLSCSAPGLATVRHEWDLLPVTLDCDMEPLAALAGQVLNPELQPIPGAVVRLLPATPSDTGAGTSAARSLEAVPDEAAPDQDGAFLFADVGEGDWTLEAAAPGFRVERLDVTVEAGERTLLDPIYLRPGRDVLVRVSGPEGEPVPGAEIIAIDPSGSVSATTDKDGEALFAHPGPETTIEVSGLEYAAERVVVPAEAEGDAARGPFDVTLRPGGWIRVLMNLGSAPGTGTDGSEQWTPCAGCEVWVVSPGSANRRLTTDGRGEVLSPPLRPGVHRVQRSRISAAGGTVIEQPGAEERTVRVTEGEITTVRFASGDHVLGLRFEPEPDPELGPWSLMVQSGGSRKVVPQESDGSFHLEVPSEGARQLPVTLSLLRFDEPSQAEAWTRVAVWPSWPSESSRSADGAGELELPRPRGQITGRALRTDTGAAEAPAADALVRLIGFHDFAWVAELRTAPDGTFAVHNLPAGVYSVQIRDLIYTYVSLSPGQSYDVGPLRLAPGP